MQLANGGTTTISHVGSYKWSNDDVLTNILVVPEFKYDLLLVSQLTNNYIAQ